jgi:large subunit ribosomal protein L17
MITSLIIHERIKTTKAKARAIRRDAEKMVTRAKQDSVHNRRIIAKDIHDKEALSKLFTEIGPRFQSRPGGYTRMLKLGPRPSDSAEMVILEFVDRAVEESAAGRRSSRRRKTEEPVESAEQGAEE